MQPLHPEHATAGDPPVPPPAPPRKPDGVLAELDQHWLRLALIAWVAIAIWFVWQRWGAIRWLALGDTDDNMRLLQVRALLAGQGWFDLVNHRFDPPIGLNIHWSRIVDLPIAGLILLLRPLVGTSWAERLACGLAPLIPLSLAIVGTAATVRRLVAPLAWPLSVALLLCCSITMPMFMPERIDHHGWQLACLALTVAGVVDPARRRGGAIVGLASAVSLSIGLEMLPYAALAGAVIALRWVWDAGERPRLMTYALALAGGNAGGFAAFASYANRVARCDALTPVWLSVMLAAGVLLFVLAWWNPAARWQRLAAAVVAGAALGVGFAVLFPQCLGRPEQVSPELARNWLANVREAKPIFRQPIAIAITVSTLPLIGLIGTALATWRARRTPALAGWLAVLAMAAFAAAMLLWQLRAGPAAQLLAVPGVTALAWWLLPWLFGRQRLAVRVGGVAAVGLLGWALFTGAALRFVPATKPKPYVQRVNRATGRCLTLPAMAPLDRLPPQVVFTFVDLGPRLVALTHHEAIAGPYHRNGAAILDVQHAFQGSADNAHAIMRRHRATLLLLCPNMAESTIYRARDPGGFYDQMAKGQVPAWLTPVPLPRHSPFRLWRIG